MRQAAEPACCGYVCLCVHTDLGINRLGMNRLCNLNY